MSAERIKEMAPSKTQRALDLATEKGSSAWLTVLPLQDLGFNLNKREFRDAVKLRYDWPVEDIPSTVGTSCMGTYILPLLPN